jgi:hypothetical protein
MDKAGAIICTAAEWTTRGFGFSRAERLGFISDEGEVKVLESDDECLFIVRGLRSRMTGFRSMCQRDNFAALAALN